MEPFNGAFSIFYRIIAEKLRAANSHRVHLASQREQSIVRFIFTGYADLNAIENYTIAFHVSYK